jgi:small subunit ribosomal protein S16
MSLVIRMSRTGRKNRPSFRVGVYDVHTRRDGPPVEPLGWFDPRAKDEAKALTVKADRVAFWIERGAQVSDTLRVRLKRNGIPVPPRRTVRMKRGRPGPKKTAK